MNHGLLLNLGCGVRVHLAWRNFDLIPHLPGVIPLDIRAPLPFASGSAAAVYHSHVLEHLDRPVAARFVAECRRVLQPGGVLRIAVPDLEGICRSYLAAIAAVDEGRPGAIDEHALAQIELLDQCVRTVPGGEMLTWWAADKVRAEALVERRMGREFRDFRDGLEAQIRATGKRPAWIDQRPTVNSPEGETRFRMTGEIHRWMYDRISLAELLRQAGFGSSRVRGPLESAIPGWAGYELDADAGGRPRKPDSLYIEAAA